MVNAYIFFDGIGSAPSGWSEISATYQNRLVSLNSVSLQTGGTDTHGHVVTQQDRSPTTSPSTGCFSGGNPTIAWNTAHSHSQGSISGTSGNNLPAYKNFRVLYAPNSGSITLPTNSIVFYDTTTTLPANWTATETGSSAFIRVASSYGGVGGGDTSGHTISGVTAQNTQYDNTGCAPMGGYCCSRFHTHNFSSTSTSHSLDYYYWSAGLIKSSSDSPVSLGMHLLFDGNPGSGWVPVVAAGRLLKISPSGQIVMGGSYSTLTHDHDGSWSCTSSGSNQQNQTTTGTWGFTTVGHTHTVGGIIASADQTPSFVTLQLYRFVGATSHVMAVNGC